MPVTKDETGNKYGKLLVISEASRDNTNMIRWNCLCDCGNTTVTRGTSLRNGHTKSCGCIAGEKHGLTNHRLYSTYRGMISRCNNPKDRSYDNYGGRGIRVLFSSLEDFINKMDTSYKEGLTLDRLDNDGHYEISNCRWATDIEQHNNRSDNTYATIKGEKVTLADAARLYNLNVESLRSRYRVCGDNFAELFRPIRGRVLYDEATKDPVQNYTQSSRPSVSIKGDILSLPQVSKIYGIHESTLYKRYHKYGDDINQLLQPLKGSLVPFYDPITLEPINDTK